MVGTLLTARMDLTSSALSPGFQPSQGSAGPGPCRNASRSDKQAPAHKAPTATKATAPIIEMVLEVIILLSSMSPRV